jgi:hypothetical protein
MEQFKGVFEMQHAQWSVSGSNVHPTFEDAMSRIQSQK